MHQTSFSSGVKNAINPYLTLISFLTANRGLFFPFFQVGEVIFKKASRPVKPTQWVLLIMLRPTLEQKVNLNPFLKFERLLSERDWFTSANLSVCTEQERLSHEWCHQKDSSRDVIGVAQTLQGMYINAKKIPFEWFIQSWKWFFIKRFAFQKMIFFLLLCCCNFIEKASGKCQWAWPKII